VSSVHLADKEAEAGQSMEMGGGLNWLRIMCFATSCVQPSGFDIKILVRYFLCVLLDVCVSFPVKTGSLLQHSFTRQVSTQEYTVLATA
jgi:hypothetical protein